jgi:hypothetical protein
MAPRGGAVANSRGFHGTRGGAVANPRGFRGIRGGAVANPRGFHGTYGTRSRTRDSVASARTPCHQQRP